MPSIQSYRIYLLNRIFRQKIWFAVLLFMFAVQPLCGNTVDPDTTHIKVRLPAEASLEQFRNDSDFKYTNDVDYGKTIMGYIKYWIAKLYYKLMSSSTSYRILKIVFYILLAAFVVFVIIKMLGIDTSGIFFKKPASLNLSHSIFLDENTEASKLKEMLQKALDSRQYRYAARIVYLLTLKQLADTGLIRWQIDKTNHSYMDEINDVTLRDTFSKLTLFYEYAWYGEFDITVEHYRDIEEKYHLLMRQIG